MSRVLINERVIALLSGFFAPLALLLADPTSLLDVRKMSSRVTPGADKQITRQLPGIDGVMTT